MKMSQMVGEENIHDISDDDSSQPEYATSPKPNHKKARTVRTEQVPGHYRMKQRQERGREGTI
jgi:hypothetical protein